MGHKTYHMTNICLSYKYSSRYESDYECIYIVINDKTRSAPLNILISVFWRPPILVFQEYWVSTESRIPLKMVPGAVKVITRSINSMSRLNLIDIQYGRTK